MHPTGLRPFLGILLFTTACGGAPSATSWDADTSAIRQLYRDWPRTAEAGDAARYVRFLDDSVTLLIPSAAPIHGIPAYHDFLTPAFENATYRASLQPPTQLQVAGSWAFAHYRGQLTTLPRAGGDSSVARNRYVDILRRQPDGSWRVFLHSWQEDVAPVR